MAPSPSRPPSVRPSDGPPIARGPRRPWYLMIALIVAWIFGASGLIQGCGSVISYRGANVDMSEAFVADIRNDEQRAETARVAENYLKTLDSARNRYFPLSVAGMLLGAVMVGFAARAMSGREGARGPLIQIALAQAALMILAHFLVADVNAAESNLQIAAQTARIRDSGESNENLEKVLAMLPALAPIRDKAWLVVRTLLSGFIVLALTRSRSREFFEAERMRSLER